VVASGKFKPSAMNARYPDRTINQHAVTFITRGVNRRGAGAFIEPPPAHKAWVVGAHTRRRHTQHQHNSH